MGKDALKRWLSRKTQSLLGVGRLHGQLAELQDRLQAILAVNENLLAVAENQRIAAEALQAAVGAIGPSAELVRGPQATPSEASAQVETPANPTANLPALQSLDKQGLFILGCARSGTTILTRSLNRSPDILLLEEPNFFLQDGLTDFVAYFNVHHATMGNRRLKGTYLPPPVVRENGMMATLVRLAGSYRLLGEKVALGPHPYPENWSQAYLDFQGKFFFHAKYLYIMRTPVESIWSMHKMFPDRPISQLFQIWLESVALSLDAYHIFPNSRVLFFDDLGQPLIERLSAWLGVSVPAVPGTFGNKYKYSALSHDDIPAALQPFANLCRECTDLYRDLRENFCREEFVYCGSMTEWAYFDTTHRHIQQMLDRLAAGEAQRPFQLRIAA